MTQTLTAIVHKEDDLYVAECSETGTASQGKTIEKALQILKHRARNNCIADGVDLPSVPGLAWPYKHDHHRLILIDIIAAFLSMLPNHITPVLHPLCWYFLVDNFNEIQVIALDKRCMDCFDAGEKVIN